MSRKLPAQEDDAVQRLDKWLFFARFMKSRGKAQDFIVGGHVRLNGQRCKVPHHALRPGDVLTLSLDRQVRVVRVLGPGERRGPSPEAALLYDDITAPSIRMNEQFDGFHRNVG
jgi:ribosome-associated heat shock protein Hsp15